MRITRNLWIGASSAALGVLLLTGSGSLALQAAQGDARSPRKPFQAQSSSSISYQIENGRETVESTNVAYQVTGTDVPQRPRSERLVLRTTAQRKEVLGDVGVEATVAVEAWPLGIDLQAKPLYTLKVGGVGAHTLDNALWVFERGTEELSWWSVHKLGGGQHLFDTHVTPLTFSISREFWTARYVGPTTLPIRG